MENHSTLWYLDRLPLYQSTKPYVINLPLDRVPGGERTNQVCVAHSNVKINDIRTQLSELNLNHNGFELSQSIPLFMEYDEFSDAEKVRSIYSEKVKEVLMETNGAEYGKVIHQMVRRRHFSFPKQARGSEEAETDQPVQGVHCDYTPKHAYQIIADAFSSEIASKMWNERRVQIIQVWRPIRGPVKDWALGVCDSTSIDEKLDLVPTDNIWSYAVFETYNVLQSNNHRWYYVSNQVPSDVLLFKGFDNAKNVSSFCAHAALEIGQADSVDCMRESVECAILLVYPVDEKDN